MKVWWRRGLYRNVSRLSASSCLTAILNRIFFFLGGGGVHPVSSCDINLSVEVTASPFKSSAKWSLTQRFQRHFFSALGIILVRSWRRCFLTVTSLSKLTHKVILSCWQAHIVVKSRCDKNNDYQKKKVTFSSYKSFKLLPVEKVT